MHRFNFCVVLVIDVRIVMRKKLMVEQYAEYLIACQLTSAPESSVLFSIMTKLLFWSKERRSRRSDAPLNLSYSF